MGREWHNDNGGNWASLEEGGCWRWGRWTREGYALLLAIDVQIVLEAWKHRVHISEKNCVIAEPPIWEAYLQVHKEAAKWKNKTFPHFEDLCIVFGKDRANGSRVRDAVEMEDVSMEDHNNQFEDNLSNDQDDASNAHTNVHSQECSSGSKKRKNKNESLHEVINNATFVLGDKLMKASEAMMEVEVQMLKKREKIADELEKFGTFSETEMFNALLKITKDSESVITFWSLKEARRKHTFARLS
ncbi:hypothetical protein L6452_32113 [Arctium lappa]|uniref:Uncharacterized protein n=1 Tax=Arctium lappa TaxID=4217 RepID=A0ACB8Z3Q9_ARCLA|nr:hypothetical protein L6452_32113 [Arctium lappa]